MSMTGMRSALLAVVLAGLLLFGYSWWRERTPTETVASAVAKERTAVAESVFAKAETVTVAGRVVVRTRRDTLLRHITDTLRVKEFIATVDTQLVHDSTALAKSRIVTERVRDELAIAQRRLIPPRFGGSVSALYDPFHATPAISASASLRVIDRYSLTARGDQRFAPGESPRVFFGVSVRM